MEDDIGPERKKRNTHNSTDIKRSNSTPPGSMYLHALYDYQSDNANNLSFQKGETVQVITQLENGWWDGVINGKRGWFPSNYCAVIQQPVDDITPVPLEGHRRRQGRIKRGPLPEVPRLTIGSAIIPKAKDDKERVKYTISTDGTACEKTRHRMLFVALGGGSKHTMFRKTHQ